MAYAGAEFAAKVLRAVKGEKGIIAPSYVNLAADKTGGDALKKTIGEDIDYFSAPVELGVSPRTTLIPDYGSDQLYQPEGVVSIKPLGKLTDAEQGLVKDALQELSGNIDKVRRHQLQVISDLSYFLYRVSASSSHPSCDFYFDGEIGVRGEQCHDVRIVLVLGPNR